MLGLDSRRLDRFGGGISAELFTDTVVKHRIAELNCRRGIPEAPVRRSLFSPSPANKEGKKSLKRGEGVDTAAVSPPRGTTDLVSPSPQPAPPPDDSVSSPRRRRQRRLRRLEKVGEGTAPQKNFFCQR